MLGATSFEYVTVMVSLVPEVSPRPAVLKLKAPTAGLLSADELSVKEATHCWPHGVVETGSALYRSTTSLV